MGFWQNEKIEKLEEENSKLLERINNLQQVIREDTKELLQYRAENEKLRAALNGILDDTTRTTMPPLMNVRMISVGALEAAAAALKETDNGD